MNLREWFRFIFSTGFEQDRGSTCVAPLEPIIVPPGHEAIFNLGEDHVPCYDVTCLWNGDHGMSPTVTPRPSPTEGATDPDELIERLRAAAAHRRLIEEHVQYVLHATGMKRDDIGCASCREATRLGLWAPAMRSADA